MNLLDKIRMAINPPTPIESVLANDNCKRLTDIFTDEYLSDAHNQMIIWVDGEGIHFLVDEGMTEFQARNITDEVHHRLLHKGLS